MPIDAYEFFEAEETLEAVAEVEHERWAHWQRYLHDQCVPHDDGSLIIPAELVERWARQMATPYSRLSEEEKVSDREQASLYIEKLTARLRELPHDAQPNGPAKD